MRGLMRSALGVAASLVCLSNVELGSAGDYKSPGIHTMVYGGFIGGLGGGPGGWLTGDIYDEILKRYFKEGVARLRDYHLCSNAHKLPYRASLLLGPELEFYLRKLDVNDEGNPHFYKTSQDLITSYMRLIWDQYPFPNLKVVAWRALFEYYRTLKPHIDGTFELEAIYDIITDPSQAFMKRALDAEHKAIIMRTGSPSSIRSQLLRMDKANKLKPARPAGIWEQQTTIRRMQAARAAKGDTVPKPPMIKANYEGVTPKTTLTYELYQQKGHAVHSYDKTGPKFILEDGTAGAKGGKGK